MTVCTKRATTETGLLAQCTGVVHFSDYSLHSASFNFFFFIFFPGIASYMGGYLVAYGACQASKHLHVDILQNTLRSPMTFHDTTPVGRIVNRFAKDLDTIDTDIPYVFIEWLRTTCWALSTLFVISYSTPIFWAIILPLGVMYYFLRVLQYV